MDSYRSIPTDDSWKNYGASLDSPTEVQQGASPRYRRANVSLNLSGLRIIRADQAETVAVKFQRLAKQWADETCVVSSLDEITSNRAYQQIINIGKDAVPLILADLKAAPKPWFYALRKISGANPIPKRAAGNLQEMTAVWLQWGRDHGYI